MMKNKKLTISIAVVVFLIAIGGFIFQDNRYNGSTIESRELILNKSDNGVTIVSETPVNNYIVCEITNQRGQYGYAVFEPKDKKNYKFQTKVWREKGSVITDFIRMDEKEYEIFMCNQSDLDYAVVSYIDNTSNTGFATEKLDLIEGRFAIIEAPNLKSYTRSVVFYDVNGNKYE